MRESVSVCVCKCECVWYGFNCCLGFYGDVFLCSLLNNSNSNQHEHGVEKPRKKVVVKRIKSKDPSAISMFAKEVRLMKSLNHTNVLKCLGFFIQSNTLNIITEFVEGGSLYDFMHSFRQDVICQERHLKLQLQTRLHMILDIARF